MSIDPKKDVIYVDIEDDITSVIEKVKSSSLTIVALVPPKRTGVLQSVVNLKLLQRAATSSKKRVVLITSDPALIGLAAGLKIPVAKNLQSRPELPTAPSTKSDDEVINGEDLPVGDHAKTADKPLELTGFPVANNEPGAAAAFSAPFAAKASGRAPKRGASVPNFDKFRKKMFIIGGAGALLIVFLVWALFFAGNASVAITAKTNIVNINKPLVLRENAKLDAAQSIAPAVIKSTKKTSSVDFTPTGKKDVGEKAKGTVEFSTDSITVIKNGTTIPAGTPLSATNGLTYVTDSNVTMTLENSDGAETTITAAGNGAKYNGALGAVSGEPDGITGTITGTTSGGTDKTVTVVSQSDVDKAVEKLSSVDSSKIKAELKKQFDDTMVVIQESFAVEPSEPTSAPAVGQEATSAKLTAETTYTMVGLSRNDLRAIYDTYTKTQIAGEKNQKVYESGDQSTKFTEFVKNTNSYSVRAQATAQVGPNIDEKALASQLTGKRSGEIQQHIEGIQGVEDVSVKLSPFWVTKSPTKAEKITIKFVVKHD